MRNTKTCYIHKRFCYSILTFLMIVCPFFAMADQHDTGSELQVPVHRQIILGFLLLAILILLVWMFFQYRKIAYELNNVKHKVENSIQVNNNLRQDLLNVNKRIQELTKDFDSEVLYQKLAAENQNNTQQVLDFLKLITNVLQNETLFTPLKTTEPSQIPENDTDKEMLSQAVVEFCKCYNIGIKDRQAWANFIGNYEQNYKIDVVNAEERYLNPQEDIAPIFKTNSAGCYLACYIVAEKLYAVVPVYDLVVELSTYTPGAFGEVFKCSHFDDRRNYQIMELIQPAIFEPDDKKEAWTLKENGILKLQET